MEDAPDAVVVQHAPYRLSAIDDADTLRAALDGDDELVYDVDEGRAARLLVDYVLRPETRADRVEDFLCRAPYPRDAMHPVVHAAIYCDAPQLKLVMRLVTRPLTANAFVAAATSSVDRAAKMIALVASGADPDAPFDDESFFTERPSVAIFCLRLATYSAADLRPWFEIAKLRGTWGGRAYDASEWLRERGFSPDLARLASEIEAARRSAS